jgi:ATP-binding cassette subfamily B protein
VTAAPASAEFSLARRFHSDRRSPLRWVWSHAARHGWLGLAMVVGAWGNAALASLVSIYVGQAFNAVIAQPANTAALLPIALWLGGTQILRGGLQLVRNFSAELLGQRLERDIRDELYVSLLGKSMTFHSLQPVGDTMARATNDVREINFMFAPGINLVVGSALFLVMPVIVAPRYHPSLMIVPLLFIVTYFLSLWQYLHELAPITEGMRESFGQLNTRLAEAIDGIETVKAAAQEENEIARFDANARGYRDGVVRQGDVEARYLPLLLLVLAQAAGLLHSLILYRQGLIDLGGVVAYFGLLQLFGFPTFTSLFAYSRVSLGLASAKRILELINRETDLDQNAQGYQGPMRGGIEFRHVTFAYPDGEPILEDLSFKLEPGQTAAIVGQTGAGKTSLAHLVNRTYDVTAGQVLVDGVDVREWDLAALRQGISIIEQDIFLFSRSIAANIAFGSPEQDCPAVEQAALAAQAHEFVASLPEGYETVIGERGVTLSGGQRQRLALARAFLTDPRVLILDDSTSAIDSATEDKIQQAIYAAARGRTTLMITHRLSQIRWADLILVLRQGKLIAVGTHDELMRTSPAYRRIFSE